MSRRSLWYLLRPAVVLHRNQVWLSEFTGTIVVALLLLALASLSITIFMRTHTIGLNARQLSNAKRDIVSLEHTLEQTREQAHIVEAVTRITRGRIDDSTIVNIVAQVYHNSRRYGYDPLLVLAVIHVESVFDPYALGRFRDGRHSGALGLMQLKEATAREVATTMGIPFSDSRDLFRPEINMLLGIGYLTQLISRFQSFKLGLLAYNQGPGTIRRTLSDNAPLSIRYYEKVLHSYYRLRTLTTETARIPLPAR